VDLLDSVDQVVEADLAGHLDGFGHASTLG
jgi:hypothetical protein